MSIFEIIQPWNISIPAGLRKKIKLDLPNKYWIRRCKIWFENLRCL